FNLFFDAVADQGIHSLQEFRIIIIIIVDSFPDKTDWTYGGKMKMVEELLRSAELPDHFVHKYRRGLGFHIYVMHYHANFTESNGIGESDSRFYAAQSSRIDTTQQNAWMLIIIKTTIILIHICPHRGIAKGQ